MSKMTQTEIQIVKGEQRTHKICVDRISQVNIAI